jgi:hypothetical protein
VEQQTPQGVFVCDHAGLTINGFYLDKFGFSPVGRFTEAAAHFEEMVAEADAQPE